jgi:hypothetical protein
MGAMALHGYSSMELKSRSFTSKEPHVAREPQVADPWPIPTGINVTLRVFRFTARAVLLTSAAYRNGKDIDLQSSNDHFESHQVRRFIYMNIMRVFLK